MILSLTPAAHTTETQILKSSLHPSEFAKNLREAAQTSNLLSSSYFSPPPILPLVEHCADAHG